jgi:hypothetical protein
MAKKIYPGNYVNRLSSYQGQPAICVPGRAYHHVTGYALVSATGGTSFDVIIPSPDKRGDDKPRADITGLVLPAGANIYFVGLRVPDMRKDRGVGTATSGLVGTATDRLKLADALANDNTITTSAVSTDSAAVVVAASGTIAPVATTESLATSAALAGSETLKVYVTASDGTSAGSTLTSSLAGGTPIIVEVAYFVDDAVADVGEVNVPYISET